MTRCLLLVNITSVAFVVTCSCIVVQNKQIKDTINFYEHGQTGNVCLNNIYFFFFMKIQTYVHNRSLVLEEAVDTGRERFNRPSYVTIPVDICVFSVSL